MNDDTQTNDELLRDPALDGFDIERELGGGGMSRLFVAIDRQFHRRVVIKIMVPTDVRSLSVDRFNREIAVATSLQHPNIVPIFSAGELGREHPLPFLVMPYIEGESLRDRLLRGPLSVRETVIIARDVSRALVYAHERGIVHRDIKPGNVLLPAGAAVVSDFGVAKALTSSRYAGNSDPGGARPRDDRRGLLGAGGRIPAHSLTAIGTSLGTPAYMAPEQAAADPNVDHRADIYALGIVVYEMLAGTPPFHGSSPQVLLRAQLADPPPPLASRRYDVPARLAELVEHCLEKEPLRRPQSASDVLRRLEDPAIISGEFAVTPGVRRRRSVSLFRRIAVGLAFVAVGVAYYLGRSTGGTATSGADSLSVAAANLPWRRELAMGPIVSIGGDARARAIADGLASELVNSLATVPGLRVGGRTATDSSTPLSVSIDPVLRIEGSVQRERTSVRVLLRAVDGSTDLTVWSAGFSGHADSVLALQERAARSAAAAIASIASSGR